MNAVKHAFGVGLCLVTLASGMAGRVAACNVPVFRYALELWEPDPYRVVLLYRGAKPELPPGVRDYLLKVEESGMVRYRELDADGNSSLAEALSASLTNTPLPVLTFLQPIGRFEDDTSVRRLALLGPDAWSLAAVKAVCESPLRTTIGKRLLSGDSAVWVFCEGPDAAANAVARRVLDEALRQAETTLKLPEPTDLTEESGRAISQLKIRLPVVVLPYDAAACGETAFRDMLVAVGAEGRKAVDVPMAFAVFGRARALAPLVGKDIVTDAIMAYCEFITGACSCEAKELNPGVDLLVVADWMGGVESLVRLKGDEPPLTGFSGFATDTASVAAAVTAPPAPAAPRSELPLRPVMFGAAGVLVVSLAALLFLRLRR